MKTAEEIYEMINSRSGKVWNKKEIAKMVAEVYAEQCCKDLQDRVEHLELERDLILSGSSHELSLEYENKWISVQDRLPESDGNYLVCLKNGYIMASHFFPSHGTSWYFLGRNSVHGSNPVTHWQLLPEPPKED